MNPLSAAEMHDLFEIREHLEMRLRMTYGTEVLLFEHGAAEGSLCRPCTVSHAHWHLVPTAVQPEELLVDGYEWEKCSDPCVAGKPEYLMVGSGRSGYWMASPATPIPSQILRRVLSERLGSSDSWDWKVSPKIEMVLQTLEDLREKVRVPPHLTGMQQLQGTP